MPTPTALHAVVFGAGAAVGMLGAGIWSRQREQAHAPTPVNMVPSMPTTPVATIPGATAMALTPSDVLRFGNPGPLSDLLTRKAYMAGYDRRLRHPNWTAEHLTAASLGRGKEKSPGGGGGSRDKSVFTEDESIPLPFRARLADYFRSGYDRGHMVPAADAKISQEAMNETFLLSNMAPQVGAGFNRHYWAYLEDWCRRLTGSFSDVYVFTVPLYLPRQQTDGKWRVSYEVIGNPPNIAVPTHFAKVVLATRPVNTPQGVQSELSTGAFVLPNAIIPDDAPLESFVMPIEAVERAAGLTFFPDSVKKSAKHICQTTQCSVIVRRFDDAQDMTKGQKRISSPK